MATTNYMANNRKEIMDEQSLAYEECLRKDQEKKFFANDDDDENLYAAIQASLLDAQSSNNVTTTPYHQRNAFHDPERRAYWLKFEENLKTAQQKQNKLECNVIE